jgi:OOP family OmpA-OmpF porin
MSIKVSIKMSNSKILLLLFTIATFISIPTKIFADASNTYINGSLGRQVIDNGLLLKTEQAISIGLERRYSNGWGAEIFWSDSSPSGRNNTGDTVVTQYGVDGLYYFQSNEDNISDINFQPYAALGLVDADFTSAVRSDKETQLRIGLGLRTVLSDHWSIKADARLIYSGVVGVLDDTFMIGLSYAFNDQSNKPALADSDNDGVVDAYDSCPNTPAFAKVDSTGCALDTDGDGVPNYADKCPATPVDRTADANGCKFALISTVGVELKVNFERDSIAISQDHYAEIEKVANFLRKYPEVDTIIEGHASSRGADAYNIKLSKARADAVMTVLIERFGIESDRVSTRGYGEAHPIATNNTEAGRLANRRVVVFMKADVSK